MPIQAAWIAENKFGAIEEAFHAMHARLYDFHDPEGAIEIVNLRLSAIGAGPALDLPVDTGEAGKTAQPEREIVVVLDDEDARHATAVEARGSDQAPGISMTNRAPTSPRSTQARPSWRSIS